MKKIKTGFCLFLLSCSYLLVLPSHSLALDTQTLINSLQSIDWKLKKAEDQLQDLKQNLVLQEEISKNLQNQITSLEKKIISLKKSLETSKELLTDSNTKIEILTRRLTTLEQEAIKLQNSLDRLEQNYNTLLITSKRKATRGWLLGGLIGVVIGFFAGIFIPFESR